MTRLLAPSILSADFSNLSQQIRYVEMGGADVIHCDVMDGKFVPNITFGPIVVKAIRQVTKLPIDVHLMIKEPEKYIADFVEAGANFVSVHVEEVVHLDRVINTIKDLGCKAGAALNPATPLVLLENILPSLNFVLLMSVNPGFGGQRFITGSLNKIRKLNEMRKISNLEFLIEVDGGIGAKNIKNLINAGCDIFVAGSSIFGQDNVTAACAELKNFLRD